MDTVNKRERVSRKGWRGKNSKLVKLGELGEWRSMRWGPEIVHPVE